MPHRLLDQRAPILRRSLLPFPVLAAVMGAGYLLGHPERTRTPSFDFARQIAPMTWWGVLFLIGAVVLTGALLARSARVAWVALFIGGCIYLWWGACLAASIVVAPHASLNAWAPYTFAAAAHFYAAWRVHP